METPFFGAPILNPPYVERIRYWELDDAGQPTQQIIEKRRPADFITPIPKPKKLGRARTQTELFFDEGAGLSSSKQLYDQTSIINGE
jgi:type III restriction enzyme